MPSPKAAARVAVHAAAARVAWLEIRVAVDVTYPEGAGSSSIPRAEPYPWAGLAIKADPAGGANAQVDPQYVAIEVPHTGISFVQIVHGIKAEFATGIYRFNDAVVATDQITFSLERIFQETVIAQELLARSIGKPFADTFSVADVFSAQLILEKTVADTFTVVDAITTKAVGLGKADSVTATDVRTVSFSQGLADSASAVDLASFAVGRVASFTDAVVVLDAPVKDVAKVAADVAIATDVITGFVFGFGRTFADSATVPDAVAKDITKGVIADSAGAVDSFSSVEAFARSFADSAGASDLIVISVTKVVADTVVVTELMLRSVGGKPEWNERELNVGEFN